MVRVVDIDPHTDRRWEAFVKNHPEALVYHHPAWLTVLQRAYGYTVHALACEDGESRLRGVLPLVKSRGLITGSRLASLPRTPVAGPLSSEPGDAAAMVHTAVERARAEQGTRLELRFPSRQPGDSLDGLTAVQAESRYVLELPRGGSELRFGNSRNHGRIKWAITKASRLGVTTRVAESDEDLQGWYGLYLDTMRAHATPPIPYRFFRAVWEVLRPAGFARLMFAEQHHAGRRRLIAGSLFFMYGDTVIYAFNGRRRSDLALRPNDVIQWRAIHDGWKAGFRRYDFGEVPEGQEGLARFKAKWGAKECSPYRYVYPPRTGHASRAAVPPALSRLSEAIWGKLPRLATARLGDLLYRYG